MTSNVAKQINIVNNCSVVQMLEYSLGTKGSRIQWGTHGKELDFYSLSYKPKITTQDAKPHYG